MALKPLTPLATARAIIAGKTVTALELEALAESYLKERSTPRLKESDFYAGRLSWGEDENYRHGSLVCLTELNSPDIWLDPVERGGYQIVYSTGGAGLYRVYDTFATISEAEVYIFAELVSRDIARHKLRVRRFQQEMETT
ncbi:hypothetical protein GURKE_01360 [Brevundimonas phage vB_BpoS-Gurke]|uniref:Uncharacterized protein n=1 Tax=Brevundimonas phage vB_BpoS-Gurke TaxID=2948599 RepID=A0A9E7N435_9CAUD|nr:hypothetical protein GURKE_01360 [Brevundimonas phage vB_BpoS-Gurke]